MRTFVIAALVLWTALAIMTANADQFYNYNGTFSGHTEKHGNSIYYYDQNGKLIGHSTKHNNTIFFYDVNGKLINSENHD